MNNTKWPQQMDRPLSPEEAELIANSDQNPIQLELISECKVPARGTQLYEILMYFQAGGRLTVGKALSQLGVYALSQRCGDLRRMGWPICSRRIETHGGANVSEYWIE
jgi:hypothetical protein